MYRVDCVLLVLCDFQGPSLPMALPPPPPTGMKGIHFVPLTVPLSFPTGTKFALA